MTATEFKHGYPYEKGDRVIHTITRYDDTGKLAEKVSHCLPLWCKPIKKWLTNLRDNHIIGTEKYMYVCIHSDLGARPPNDGDNWVLTSPPVLSTDDKALVRELGKEIA